MAPFTEFAQQKQQSGKSRAKSNHPGISIAQEPVFRQNSLAFNYSSRRDWNENITINAQVAGTAHVRASSKASIHRPE
jgi:hypothetical protein